MKQARIYALLSALASLVYLVSIPTILVMLFVNWRVALWLVPIALAAPLLAKWLNGLKLKQLYGKSLGSGLNDLDWDSGRQIDP
jgi:hypothetical protein